MTGSKPLALIVATTPDRGIGKDGKLPWHLPSDLKYFKKITSDGHNAVVMGTATWESIPAKFRPLPNRLNVVVSTTKTAADFPKGVLVAESVRAACAQLESSDVKQIFVIGGERAFREALQLPQLQQIYWTRIGAKIACDRFLDEPAGFQITAVTPTQVEGGVPFDFAVLERSTRDGVQVCLDMTRRDHPEYQYLDLIRELCEQEPDSMMDRTGTGVRSKFGCQMRFDLKQGFPLLTTKRVFWRGVVEELLWFIKGDTNAKNLTDRGVKIWEANGSREFLDSRGLSHREEGDLGPVYGFQWRHFGAKYVDMHTDYSGQGVDQLAQVIETLKKNPADRRIIMSAWNPADLDAMALPPCHMFCQFYVKNGELSSCLYQRSCDMGLGVPFNIASYALLTLMIAQVTGLRPGEFVHMMGNTHVYENHVEPLKEQLGRVPRTFPLVQLADVPDIDSFKPEHIELLHYHPHAKVEMKMAV